MHESKGQHIGVAVESESGEGMLVGRRKLYFWDKCIITLEYLIGCQMLPLVCVFNFHLFRI